MDKEEQKKLLYLIISVIASGDSHILPELIYLLNPDTFARIVKIFGGRYIRIPTEKELKRSLKTILYYYYVEIEKEDPQKVLTRLRIDGYSRRFLNQRLEKFKEGLVDSQYGLPQFLHDTTFFKDIMEDLCEKD